MHSQAPVVATQLSPCLQVTPAQKATQTLVVGSQRWVGSAEVQVSGVAAHSHFAVDTLQRRPAAHAGAHAVTQREVAPSHLVFGSAPVHESPNMPPLHLHASLTQVSPRAQVTPLQVGPGSTQCFCGPQILGFGQLPCEHSHAPLVALQASPLLQLTPAQRDTHLLVPGSHFVAGT